MDWDEHVVAVNEYFGLKDNEELEIFFSTIKNSHEEDSRFPYTHADDFIRTLAGWNGNGTKLSRSDASKIINGIAKVIGMNTENLACLLAEAELNKTDEERKNEVSEMIKIINFK